MKLMGLLLARTWLGKVWSNTFLSVGDDCVGTINISMIDAEDVHRPTVCSVSMLVPEARALAYEILEHVASLEKSCEIRGSSNEFLTREAWTSLNT